jgi:hypothetical protein
MSSTTEIRVLTGECYRVAGSAKDVAQVVLDAARGSIMQFAWFVDAETGADLAVNPQCVAVLRAPGSSASSHGDESGLAEASSAFVAEDGLSA